MHCPTILFIGIDVSKDHLVCAFQLEQGQWKVFTVKNNEQGIEHFIQSLEQPDLTHIIVEATGTYSMKLTFMLCRKGIKVSVLNPKQSKGFTQGVLLSTTKTDEQDACALALYGMVNRPKCFTMPHQDLLKIRQLQNLVIQLKKQQRSIANQLHALDFHPQPESFVLDMLQQNLDRCEQQIKQTQEKICDFSQQTFQQAYHLATSVVGIGPATAQAILVATNALKGFDNSKQLAKFVGVCPTQHQSGTSIKGRGHIAKTGDPHIRAMLYMAARSAKRYNLPCKALYERLRAKGKCHRVAMVAVSNKLLRQLFAVVTSQKPFEREFHLKFQNEQKYRA